MTCLLPALTTTETCDDRTNRDKDCDARCHGGWIDRRPDMSDPSAEHDEITGDVMITVWPADMLDGDPYPPDFYARLDAVLTAAGFLWERC